MPELVGADIIVQFWVVVLIVDLDSGEMRSKQNLARHQKKCV
jgi:hypothetical protein